MTNKELKRIQNALKHQQEVSIKFGGNIIVIGKDPNNKSKNIYYCIQHDEFFSYIPGNILKESRKGCSICSGYTIWTTESIIKRIQFLNQDEFGNNTLVIDEFDYKNINQEIWLTCLIDSNRWKASIGNLIHKETGCRICANRNMNNHLKISFDDLHRRNNEINTDENGILRIIIKCTRKWYEEHYKGAHTKIWVRCSEGHPDYQVSVNDLLNGETGCKQCVIESRKLTRYEFFNRIPQIFLNENGKPLHKFNFRNYNGYNSSIWIFDPDYGWFKKTVAMYLQGYGHPNSLDCKSKGELAIQEFLLTNQIKFIREYHFLLDRQLRFDFFLADQNVAIEFDGPQHDEYIPWFHETIEDFYKQLQNDRKKDQWCIDNSIQLIRITNIKDIPNLLNFLSIEK